VGFADFFVSARVKICEKMPKKRDMIENEKIGESVGWAICPTFHGG
jgi:hypothetical protein